MITRDDIMKSSRIATSISRFHTWPKLNRQSVAEHSYHILRIWWHMWGPPPPEVTEYAIWHDAGEMATGDLPYPVKMKWPKLKAITQDIEAEHLDRMGVELVGSLDVYDKRCFKVVDLCEMLEFGLVEVQMGNRMAEPIVQDVAVNITKLLHNLQDRDRAAVRIYLANAWNFELEMPEEPYDDARVVG